MKITPIISKSKILKNKKLLEEKLNVKLEIKGKNILISGEEINEYLVSKVLEALNLGFDLDTALLLKDEEFMLEILHIKDLTKRKNLTEIKARVIGTKGKTIRNLSNLSDCDIVLKDNTIAIIGKTQDMRKTIHAIVSLVQGSKQSSVYTYLERERKHFFDEDLGLKIKEKREKVN